MNVRSTIAVAAILGSVAAGGAWTIHRPPVADGSARHVLQGAQGMKWTATLKPETGSTVAGTATLGPGSSAGTSVATISITGGTPGASYPWHVHMGKCGAGGVFGGGASYKPVKAGSDGTGTSTADLKAAAPTTGDYHVNVHASSTNMKTVACGEFSMAGM
jgi:superoxide dismutase, Cu-Zn family